MKNKTQNVFQMSFLYSQGSKLETFINIHFHLFSLVQKCMNNEIVQQCMNNEIVQKCMNNEIA